MILAAYYHPILATLFGLAAVLLMGVILLQRGKGVGLAGAFGGAGGHTAFGAKTGDVLTWITIVAAAVVLTGAVVLNYVFVPPKLTTMSPPPPVTAPVVPAAMPTTPTQVPITPAQTPVGATETPAATPDETSTPTETTPPAEAPEEQQQETPEGSWNPAERAAWPQYARCDIFGAVLG